MKTRTVVAGCADVKQYKRTEYGTVDTGRTMLCQKKAAFRWDRGDSGSPVYITQPGGYKDKDAVGIFWGADPADGSATFSSLGYAFWEFDQATGGSGSRYLASQTNLSHR